MALVGAGAGGPLALAVSGVGAVFFVLEELRKRTSWTEVGNPSTPSSGWLVAHHGRKAASQLAKATEKWIDRVARVLPV